MVDPLADYETGPDATLRATAEAWSKVDDARAVVLVEGVSDQIAVDATAEVVGVDLAAVGVVVVPIGGAHAIGRALAELRRRNERATVGGLCDAGEERYFRRALTAAGYGDVEDRDGLERRGFFVCVDDLEDELIRAAGRHVLAQVFTEQGDGPSFAAMQAQPQWRDAAFEAQARRFFGAGARRKHRYAAAIVAALGPERVPAPLVGVVRHVRGGAGTG